MKRLIHDLFGLHKWKWYKYVWDYSEPHERLRGDYLPTKGSFYKCDCKKEKRIYKDGFTHLGVLPPRIFYF